MIGKWRYGIVNYKRSSSPEYRFFGIGELYYKDDPNKIYYCSSQPIEPYSEIEDGDPKEQLIIQLQRMINDITKFPEPFDEDGPFEKEEEDYAGHLGFIPDDLDEESLDEYIKSIQED